MEREKNGLKLNSRVASASLQISCTCCSFPSRLQRPSFTRTKARGDAESSCQGAHRASPRGSGAVQGPGTLWPWGGHQPHPQGTPGCSGAHREDAGGWVGSSMLRPCLCLCVLESLWVQEALSWQRAGAGFGMWRGPSMAVGGFCVCALLCVPCLSGCCSCPGVLVLGLIPGLGRLGSVRIEALLCSVCGTRDVPNSTYTPQPVL